MVEEEVVTKKLYRQLQIWSITWTLGGDFEPTVFAQRSFYSEIASRWCFQKERGEEHGLLHYQINLNLRKKLTKQALLRSFVSYFNLDVGQIAYIHIRPTSVNGTRAAFSYCMKEDTRVGDYYCDSSYYFGKDLQVFEKPRPFPGEDYFFVKRRT